ncbi:MAG: Gfo/Idh/MocA family oxidoreductase [Verrucomicrobiota bacterium JB022]|nr:Gfo/Idh/MocA family oxidoreductase [Verrucomicrobiota bacterium JB022]
MPFMLPHSLNVPRIALIGATGYAQIYLDLLREAYRERRVQIVAAAIIESQQHLDSVQELRSWGATIYPSYDSMLAAERGKLDLCLIPTGIQWHARMTVAALEAGCNVLVEKPLAGDQSDGEAIIAAEKATGKWVAVGFQDVYCDEVKWLKQELLNGAIGRVKSLRMIGMWPRARGYFSRNSWAGRLYADGAATMDSPLNNAFAHFVNLSLYFAGSNMPYPAEAKILHAELLRAHDIQSFDTAVVQAISANDIHFWFGVSHATAINREPEIYINGEKGHAQWFHDRKIVLAPQGQAPTAIESPDYDKTRHQMFEAVMQRLQDGETAVYRPIMALPHTSFITDLHRDYAIQSFSPEEFSWNAGEAAESIPCVHGIEQALDIAMKQRATLQSVRPYHLTEVAAS